MYIPGVQFLTEPGSDLVVNLSPTERVLGRSALFCIGEHRCSPRDPWFEMGGGPHTCPYIGFMRSAGVLRAPADSKAQIHTPNTAGFGAVGSSFTRRALNEVGEHSEWIAISPAFLAELAEDGVQAAGRWNGKDFPTPFAPLSLEAFFAQRHLVEALSASACPSDLAFDEYVARLVATVLRDAFRFWNRRSNPRRLPRPVCEQQRVAIVESAKQRIATDYGSNHSLASLAHAVNCSPGQLARIFPAQTGFTLHEYRQHIRLRMALQLLRETPADLCAVAERLGFASHSHFSTVFAQRFGMPPSRFARNHPRRLLNSMLDSMDGSLQNRQRRMLRTNR
jgi:AraC-like DNA-binding protein